MKGLYSLYLSVFFCFLNNSIINSKDLSDINIKVPYIHKSPFVDYHNIKDYDSILNRISTLNELEKQKLSFYDWNIIALAYLEKLEYIKAFHIFSFLKKDSILYENLKDYIEYYYIYSLSKIDSKKIIPLIDEFRKNFPYSEYNSLLLDTEAFILFENLDYKNLILKFENLVSFYQEKENFKDIKVKLNFFLGKSYQNIYNYKKMIFHYKKVLSLEKSYFFTQKIYFDLNKNFKKWNIKEYLSTEDALFMVENFLSKEFLFDQKNEKKLKRYRFIYFLLLENKFIYKESLSKFKKWLFLNSLFYKKNNKEHSQNIMNAYLSIEFFKYKNYLLKYDYPAIIFFQQISADHFLKFIKVQKLDFEVVFKNIPNSFKDKLKEIIIIFTKEKNYQKINEIFIALLKNKKYKLFHLLFFFTLKENKDYIYESFINEPLNFIEKTKDFFLISKVYFWIAKLYQEDDKKKQALSFYKKVFFINQYSYYGAKSVYYLKENLEEKTYKSLFLDYEKNYQQVIIKKEFIKKINSIKKEYDFTQLKNKNFLKFLFFIQIGNKTNAKKYLNKYIKEDLKEEKEQYYLVFLKFFKEIENYKYSISFANNLSNYLNQDLDNKYIFPQLINDIYPVFYKEKIKDFLKDYPNLSIEIILSIIHIESRFYHLATSRANAMGLMQVLKKTADEILKKLKKNLPNSLQEYYNKDLNLEMGIYYINLMFLIFKNQIELAIGAYNAGPNKMKKLLFEYKNIKDPDAFVEHMHIEQTKNYIKKVMEAIYIYKKLYNF